MVLLAVGVVGAVTVARVVAVVVAVVVSVARALQPHAEADG